MNGLTVAAVCGAGVGAGIAGLIAALYRSAPDLVVALGRYDAAQHPGPVGDEDAGPGSGTVERVGTWAARHLARRGLAWPRVGADLALLGRSYEALLGQKIILAVYGLLLVPVLGAALTAVGISLPVALPATGAVALAAAFFFVPDLELRRASRARRRELLRAFTVFLNLVDNSLAGGRGAPEALPLAAGIGRSWAFELLAETIAAARLTGRTPWQELAELGRRLQVHQLEEFGAQVALVADEGARIRESLQARAASLRRGHLADIEGKAGEANESMEIVVAGMAVLFMIFLLFPALYSFGLL